MRVAHVCEVCGDSMWRLMISPENIQQVRNKQIDLWYCNNQDREDHNA